MNYYTRYFAKTKKKGSACVFLAFPPLRVHSLPISNFSPPPFLTLFQTKKIHIYIYIQKTIFSVGCSDFATYEDAFRWYEYYQPYYGDVAKLDRDGDGVPCPGLPHTTNQQQYRMKVPSKSRGS